MATVKRISGDYNISTLGQTANVGITTHTVTINGNLLVVGNTTSVTSNTLSISDNMITLNKGEIGAGVTLVYSGIEIDRGSLPNVAIRWDENLTAFQATEDGTTWKYLLTSNLPGGITKVEDDPSPKLGGNLNITGHTIYDTAYNVTVYAGTPGGGSTGLYVSNNLTTQDELATRTRAIVYGLIL